MEKLKLKRKPSCPKEFFAKLYGHLDDKKKLEKINLNITPHFQDLVPSKMMKTFVKTQKTDESSKNFEPNVNSNKISPVSPLFPTAFSKTDLFHHTKAAAFAAGITAFFARKKRKEGRPRRQRTTFSNEQTISLELEYNRNEYVSRGRRSQLAESLRMTETQVKIWFQNRRAKDKRIEKAQIDQQYRNIMLESRLNEFSIPHSTVCGVWFHGNKLYLNQYDCCIEKNWNCNKRGSTQAFSFSIINESLKKILSI